MRLDGLEAIRSEVEAGRLDTIVVCFPDMQGRLVGKRFHAACFVESAWKETHACDYLLADDIEMEPVPGYAAANWTKGYGDFVLRPDLSAVFPTPWAEGTAVVLSDVEDHRHAPVPHSPRAILKAQVARLAERGYTANAASELEFYLFDEDYAALRARRYRDPKATCDYIEDYHVFQTMKEEPVMRAIRNGLVAAGVPVECSKGEWGPGQEEINVRYADALTMADRHVFIKNAIKEIAHLQGKAVTFMAKWNAELAGNSCHVHLSLARDGEPAFRDPEGPRGMSTTMRRFLAGQLTYAREITLFLAPYMNSYKRFMAGTFAPTKAVWATDNRTAGFRVVGEGGPAIRAECRIGGADLNPYLAFAALIAAGLAGIEEGLELEDAFQGDAYGGGELREVPKTLREATALADGSGMLRAAFGDAVIDHYVHTARWEQAEFDRRVTDLELMRGFERY